LPDLPVQYIDFAAWQERLLNDESLKKQIDYWFEQLSGAPATINLPSDRPRPSVRSFSGAKHSLAISKVIAEKLTALGRENRATLFMTLLAAFQALLACITGDEDLVVGSPIVGRNRAETENLIGNFINTIVLRAKFSGDPDFNEMLRQVRDTALGAFANQDVPFEKLVREMQPTRTLSHNPLFQVWFVLQNAQPAHQEFAGLTTETIYIDSTVTRHDLQLTLWEAADGLHGTLNYSSDLFEPESIALIEKQFQALLQRITAERAPRLSVLRASLAAVAREYREQLGNEVEESGRRKLRSVKRKAVGRAQPATVEESWTTPS
jgi:non-ribosomal peptide synthetase component F